MKPPSSPVASLKCPGIFASASAATRPPSVPASNASPPPATPSPNAEDPGKWKREIEIGKSPPPRQFCEEFQNKGVGVYGTWKNIRKNGDKAERRTMKAKRERRYPPTFFCNCAF